MTSRMPSRLQDLVKYGELADRSASSSKHAESASGGASTSDLTEYTTTGAVGHFCRANRRPATPSSFVEIKKKAAAAAFVDGVPLPEQYERRATRRPARHRRDGDHRRRHRRRASAGSGKSTMAVCLARSGSNAFPTATAIRPRAHGRRGAGDGAARLASRRAAVAIRRALAGRRRPIVLDDVWTAQQRRRVRGADGGRAPDADRDDAQ